MINWISVKDRLPSHGTNVLVLIESHESPHLKVIKYTSFNPNHIIA
jgi:hypothetical protein